ncbi:hypothetical protein [Streptomyces sp. NPDC006324]|uniref:hypothetical protein n=1 Tax=Streptomyces sp. NPDC006324 TaxID=3156751 RepID=UPI0033A0B0A1
MARHAAPSTSRRSALFKAGLTVTAAGAALVGAGAGAQAAAPVPLPLDGGRCISVGRTRLWPRRTQRVER